MDCGGYSSDTRYQYLDASRPTELFFSYQILSFDFKQVLDSRMRSPWVRIREWNYTQEYSDFLCTGGLIG
jgi:hypothetical protein